MSAWIRWYGSPSTCQHLFWFKEYKTLLPFAFELPRLHLKKNEILHVRIPSLGIFLKIISVEEKTAQMRSQSGNSIELAHLIRSMTRKNRRINCITIEIFMSQSYMLVSWNTGTPQSSSIFFWFSMK